MPRHLKSEFEARIEQDIASPEVPERLENVWREYCNLVNNRIDGGCPMLLLV